MSLFVFFKLFDLDAVLDRVLYVENVAQTAQTWGTLGYTNGTAAGRVQATVFQLARQFERDVRHRLPIVIRALENFL